MSRGIKKKTEEADEVEELLRAAEEDVFLKLNLNSHMARGSSTQFIDPDLDQRFQSLKSKKTPNTNKKNLTISQQTTSTTAEDSADDLLARFAALKSALPSSASSSAKQAPVVENEEQDDDDDDDEVEKVIKWAIDAARLDPSPPSDIDDDGDDSSSDPEDDEDSDQDDKVNRGKSKAKRK